MGQMNGLQTLVIWALPVLFAITVHEVAHGWMAKQLGDRTAMMLGRLTLNPLKHIDPIGTVIIPVLMLMMGGFIFGWAKPVPVTWENLRHPKKDMALVAIAGPAANLIMAILWVIVMKLAWLLSGYAPMISEPLIYMGAAGVTINIVLMILNLLPIPPLDGSRIISSFLPDRMAWRYNQLENYGLLILLTLLVTGALGWMIGGPISKLQAFLYLLAGV